MSKLEIDKEKLLGACEKCPQVKQFAQEMWPEIFEESVTFETDDIVEVIRATARDPKDLTGKIGVVVSTMTLNKEKVRIGIEFQESISGLGCGGRTPGRGHRWSVWPKNLKLLYRKPSEG